MKPVGNPQQVFVLYIYLIVQLPTYEKEILQISREA